MATVLSEVLDEAQQALDGGDHRSAAETCAYILEQYPNCMAAQRLLGLASLHQGKTAEAERALGRVLAADPRDPDAYFGLGVIAEERGVLENAMAFCQVAWELAPTRHEYRELVERVAGKRYGPDGHLQFTHAALAELHVTNQRLSRAIREYQTALGALPERVDLWLGLAESLWRLGQDEDAAEISREFLREHPDLTRALVMLADIEHRQGNADEAEEFRQRYRRLDQDGRLVNVMLAHNPHAAADFLLLPADQMPQLDPRTDHVIAERPTIAPAPDFTYQPEETEPAADIEELEPMEVEEFTGGESSDEGPQASYPEPEITQQLPEIGAEEHGATEDAGDGDMDDLLAELERPDSEPVTHQPAESDLGDIGAGAEAETPDADADLEAAFGAEQPEPAEQGDEGGYEDLAAQFDRQADADSIDVDDDEMADLLAEFEGIEPMRPEDFGASEDEIQQMTSGMFQDAEIDFDMRIEDDDSVQIGGGPPAGAPQPFEPSADLPQEDHLEPEEFPEFPDVEESDEQQAAEPEQAQEEAPPPPAPQQPEVPSGTGYTRLLGELGEEGLAPFDPSRTAGDPSAGQEQPEEDPFGNLAESWDDVDREIEEAIPTRPAQTDELGDLADLDIEPFRLDDEDAGEESLVDETPAPREVESEPPALEPEPEDQLIESAPGAETGDSDEEFEGIEPFTFEDFEADDDGDTGYGFGQMPWDSDSRDSALPSDEALEAMLGSEAGAEPESEPEPEPAPELEPEPEPEPAPEDLSAEDAGLTDFDDYSPVEDFDPSLAGTHKLGGEDQQVPSELEERMSELETAAADELGQYEGPHDESFFSAPTAPFHAEQGMPEAEELPAEPEPSMPDEPAAEEFAGGADLPQTDAERLASDEGLFERTRSAKSDLVSEGLIRGDRELEGEAPEEPPAEPAEPVEEQYQDYQGLVAEQPVEETFEMRTGATGDIDTLRASLQADPNDPELHWWLAEALRKAGETREAFDEYRWLIREAPARHKDVIQALNACVDARQEDELAHRLLADIYRRMGDSHQARTHASSALAARRRRR